MGLETTFELLENSANEAATDLLVAALDSPRAQVRDGALRALAGRRGMAGHRELLRRWHRFPESWKTIVGQRPERVGAAVREAVLGENEQTCVNGCDVLLWTREYELLPALIHRAEGEPSPPADLAADTLVRLVELFYDELAQAGETRRRRDPQLLRQHLLASLEAAAQRFDKHQRREILEAFLLLAHRDNSTLKKILQDPHSKTYLPLLDLLAQSQRPGVLRLVLAFLEDPHAPLSALLLAGRRKDLEYLRRLLKKIGFEPSQQVRANLKRLDAIAWLRGDLSLLAELNDAEQHAAMQLAHYSNTSRLEVFEVVRWLLTHGTPGGRRAAAARLHEHRGAEANQLALAALADEDPQVQAHVLAQLRERGVPGAIPKLIALLDSPHAAVRQAARESLGEFRFERFLAAFDMLDDEVRRGTGALVKKVDPQWPSHLLKEFESNSRTRRLRAVQIATLLGGVEQVLEHVQRALGDEDHFVRAAAAEALGRVPTPEIWALLRDALADRSVVVQEAAQKALQQHARAGEAGPARGAPQPASAGV